VELCSLCEQGHSTDTCPALPKLKAAMQSNDEEVEQAYFVNQRKPWQQQRTQGMSTDHASSFNSSNNIYNQGLPQYPMQYPMPNVPQAPWQAAMPNQYPTPWMPWGPNPQQSNVPNSWNWRNPPFQRI
jgi:hypothetical protein